MANTETLTLFPCRKTKVLYTFKKSSPLKASCITQIGCHLQFKWRTPCKFRHINKRSAQSVSDIDINNLHKTHIYLKQNSYQNCSFSGKN